MVRGAFDHPEVFAKTVFIINYDEAGGFFDHALPSLPPLSPEDGASTVSTAGEGKLYQSKEAPIQGLHPIGLGIRVPAIGEMIL